MSRKPGLTRRQHVELGATLQRVYEDLVAASVLLSNSYPQTAKCVKASNAAWRGLDTLRCELDNVSANQLPGDLWSPTIYYGANREIRAAWLAANPLDDEP